MGLQALDDTERAALRAVGRQRSWPRGTSLYHEGDRSDWVALLERGQVKVSTLADDGYESVLAVRGPGETVGELSAIDGRPRSATVVALEPLEATVVDAEAFRAFLTGHPGVALRLLQVVASRLRDADRKRAEFGAQDTTARVARRLVELAETRGVQTPEGVMVDLAITQEELAGWVGASRESVSRALRTLRQRGLIRTQRRSVCVPDLDALRARGG